jgi:hypothetical protein
VLARQMRIADGADEVHKSFVANKRAKAYTPVEVSISALKREASVQVSAVAGWVQPSVSGWPSRCR